MNGAQRLQALGDAARRREIAIAVALAAPPAASAIVIATRGGGAAAALPVALVAVAAVLAWVRRASRRADAAWLARRLDARAPAFEDSAALLLDPGAATTPLQRLQAARLDARIAAIDADLRTPWPRRALLASFALAVLVAAAALAWLRTTAPPLIADRASTNPAARPTGHRLAAIAIEIAPPAYTHLPARIEKSLDVKAAQGATLRWRLRFEHGPKTAALLFHDGSRIDLRHDGGDWIAEHVLTTSLLYRIVADGAPALADDRLHRLDVVADAAPEVRVLQPDKSLSLIEVGQKSWQLAFEASDDYGIARAELGITHAQGTGENITFKDQSVVLEGTPQGGAGDARHVAYTYSVDLAALALAEGDDVVVRVAVSDAAEPKPNTTRSASFILRWPAKAATDSAGLEGVVQQTLPAYFRSQRQIIIDSEALLADKPTLAAEKYLARSDSIGVDQKILRLRYGQFLGEESETHAEVAADLSPKGHDADKPDQVDALAAAHTAQERELPSAAATKFGQEGNTVAEYGHVHDIAEAATLLDRDTRATLKSALDEMWQSELNLRQGRPDQALPYEHRALELIKQVQQSTRIYLARVGLELPKPDEARRLSGDRKDLADRAGTLAPARVDSALVPVWNALTTDGKPEWALAQTWLRAHSQRLPDALGALAALDRAEREPDCRECREQLANLLWPALPAPATATRWRAAPDAQGRAYLDALRGNAEEAGARP